MNICFIIFFEKKRLVVTLTLNQKNITQQKTFQIITIPYFIQSPSLPFGVSFWSKHFFFGKKNFIFIQCHVPFPRVCTVAWLRGGGGGVVDMFRGLMLKLPVQTPLIIIFKGINQIQIKTIAQWQSFWL